MQKHLQKLLLMVSMIVVPWVTQAQMLSEYEFSTGVDASRWITLSSPTNVWTSYQDDAASSVFSLGFTFPFGNGSYSQFSVSSNGIFKLGSSATVTTTTGGQFTSSYYTTSLPKICGIARDMSTGSNGYVRYQLTGTAPNRVFVCEFALSYTYGSSYAGDVKWQVQLHEDSSKVVIVYGPTAPGTTPSSFQTGLAETSDDIIILNPSTHAPIYCTGAHATTYSTWHGVNRYYQFVRPVVTCPRPIEIRVSNLGLHGFDIAWTDTTDATSWVVQLDSSNNLIYNNVEYTDSISFASLSPNTYYTARVAGICQSGDTSTFRSVMVHTPCSYLDSMPFFYDFESAATGTSTTGTDFVNCWNRLNNGSSYGGYPYVGSSSTYNHTPGGSKGLYWYNTTTTGTYGDYQVVVLPGVDTDIYPIRTLQMRFWAKSSSTSYNPVLYVGVMSNPDDISTFQYLDTIEVGNSTNWQEFESLLSLYSGDGRFVAVRANRASWTAYVDDFTLEEIPPCPRTSELTQTDATLNSVTISWTEMGSATQWVLEYDTVDFVPGTGAANIEYPTTTTHTLYGLDSAHSYYIYLHADCDGDTSINRFLLASTLAASPATTPFFCDFEGDGTNGWELLNGNQTNIWVVDSAVNNGGGKSLYISNDGGTSNAYSTGTISYAYAYRTIDFTDTGEYSYTYDWRGQGESHYYDFTRVFLSPAGYQWEENNNPASGTYAFSTWTAPAGFIELTENFSSPRTLASSSSWRTATGTFRIESPAVYNLVFAWANDGSGGTQPPTAIDNVGITRNTCPSPTAWSVHITSDSVIIAWTPGGSELNWYVESDSLSDETTDTFFVFDNLMANTDYSFRVRALCDVGDTSLPAVVSVRTLCTSIDSLPFTETFESAPTGTSSTGSPFAYCWHHLNNGTSYGGYPYVSSSSTYNHTPGGNKGLYWYNTTTTGSYGDYQIVVLPNVDTDIYPINTLQLSFWARSSSTSYSPSFQVGVMTDPNDASTFTVVGNVPIGTSTTFTEYTVPLGTYTGYGQFVALRAVRPTSSWYAYVDDFTLEVMPTCPDVEHLSVQATVSNARVSWDYDTLLGVTPSNYIVQYGYAADSLVGATTLTTSSTSLILNGLTPDTSYTISVAVDCGGTPGAASVYNFSTLAFPCLQWDTASSGPVQSTAVGTDGTTGTYYMPVNEEYNYSYCQHLIRTSEITFTSPTMINAVGFQYMYEQPLTQITNCSIYLAHTSVTTLPSPNFIPYDSLQLVYVGPLNCPTSGWNYFQFNRGNFHWDGVRNMVIGIVNNSGTHATTSHVFGYHVPTSGSCLRTNNNDTPYGPGNMGTSTTTSNWRSNMRLLSGGGDCLELATCAAPNVVVDSFTSTSASLSWIPGHTESAWDIDYRVVGTSSWTSAATAVGTTNYTIMGLSPNTQYQVRVGSSCSDTSYYGSVMFRTECGLLTVIPWSDDLESCATGSSTTGSAFIPCWNHLNNGTSYGGYPYVSSSSSYSHGGGTKGLYWYNTTTTGSYGDYQCVVLPGIDTTIYPINTLQVRFWAKPSSSSYVPVFKIGIMRDPTDITTFQGIDTITLTSTDWTEIEVPFTSFTGQGYYPAIKADRPSSSWYAYVDDFHIEAAPTCSRPSNLTSTSNTSTSITLTWNERNSATEWELAVETSATATPTGDSIVTNRPLTVTGLTGGVNYYFYVRSICGVGDTSEWSDVLLAVPGSWNMRANMTDTLYMCGGAIYDEGGPNGAYYTGNQDSYVIIMPDAPNNLVSVSGSSYTESSFDWIRIYDGIGTSGTELWNDYGVSSYQTFGPFISSSGPITVHFHTDGSVYYDGFSINVTCITAYCRITNLRQDPSVPQSDVQLAVTWDTNGADYYEVAYGAPGFIPSGSFLTTYTNSAVITGLTGLTNYDVCVRSICNGGADTGSWSRITLQTAMCDNISIAENWDSTSVTDYTNYGPIGYSCYNYSYNQMIIDSSYLASLDGDITAFGFKPYNSASDYGNYFNGIDIYMANISESTFSNDVIRPDSNHQFVQVLHNANCNFTNDNWQVVGLDTTFTWDGHSNILFVINRRHGSWSCSAEFEGHSTSGYKSVVIYNDDSAFNHINSLSIATTDAYSDFDNVVGNIRFYSCGAAGCRQPVITGVSHTYENATVTWTGEGTEYEVNYKESAAPNWPATDIHVTGNTYTFTGLQPATYYTFRVRQDCNADSLGYSDWVIGSFLTDSLPCLAPDSLTVTAVTNATATLDWVPFGYETMWDVHVWYSGGIDSIYTVSAHPATVGGFTANTTYNAAIRPLCGSAHNIVGEWGDTITFTTAVCPDVTGLTSSDLHPNSVTLTWTADPMAQQWIIEYGYRGFDQGTGTTITTTLNTYTINGLVDDMQYDFLVRAVCGTDWQSENWASITVTTPSGGVPCEAPTNVSAVVAGNSATISWTANTGNLSYTLEYGPRGFAHGSGITVNATSSPITLSNLDYDTDYDVYVQGVCDQNTLSAWSTVVSFTTEPQGSQDCDPVTDLAASNVTESSALLSWTPGATGDEWEVVLTTAAGTTVSEASTTEHQYALNGLTPGTAYVAKVRTVCGDGVYSTFASTTFTTNSVGIDGVAEPGCTIYPNPTSSTTTITVAGVSGKVKIAVIDMNGREVASETLECSGDCAKSFDVDRLAQGAYFVRVTGENVSMVRKLIVR